MLYNNVIRPYMKNKMNKIKYKVSIYLEEYKKE
jgi:hypothetical protein